MVPLLQRLTLEKPQSKQRALPRLSAPRLGSAFPHSGIAPRAAATGHPWPGAAKPASCRFTRSAIPAPQYLRSASGLLGQSDQDQKQEHSGLPAGLSVRSQIKSQSESKAAFLWELACSRKT